MSLGDTGPRVLLAALVALALFTIAFFIARGTSSQAALPAVAEQTAKGVTPVRHAPLRAIGSVPALPRAPKKRNQKPPPPPAGGPVTPVAPPAPPPPPPPPPPPVAPPCIGEICP